MVIRSYTTENVLAKMSIYKLIINYCLVLLYNQCMHVLRALNVSYGPEYIYFSHWQMRTQCIRFGKCVSFSVMSVCLCHIFVLSALMVCCSACRRSGWGSPPHTRPPKPLYSARAVCSAAEGILLFFQWRSREVKFHSFTETSLVSGASIATTYSKQMLYFSTLIGSLGLGPRERYRADLRAYVFLLLGCSSHRCFVGKSLLVMIMALHFLKMSPFSFFSSFIFCFGCVFGQAETLRKNYRKYTVCFHWESAERLQNQW